MIYQNITTVNAETIQSLINSSAKRHNEMISLYGRYKGEVPIKTRKYYIDDVEQQGKINNKLANDFFSEIVDLKVGFFCGVPISYVIVNEIDDKTPEDDFLERFNKINSMPDMDIQNAKMSTICGYSSRLFYYTQDVKPEVRISQINPWEVIFIGQHYEKPDISIRYYDIEELKDNGEFEIIHYADVYDQTTLTKYKKKEKDEKYKQYETALHMFPGNPLIGFLNNEETQGDCEKVLSLIDAYDRTDSDVDSELEQFRLAYLAVFGMDIDPETIELAKKTGAFSVRGEGADVKFITKALDDTIIEHHLDRQERNIYRFSRTPNMNDEAFAGDISGVAMKYKFRAFEDKSQTSELKYKKGLRAQYELLTNTWKLLSVVDIDPLDVDFIFTRKYPQNLLEEIEFLNKSKGIITDETAFAQVSFIEDPKEEIEKLDEQKEADMEEFLKMNPQQDNKDVKGVDDDGSK